jgi:hypothetical protein
MNIQELDKLEVEYRKRLKSLMNVNNKIYDGIDFSLKLNYTKWTLIKLISSLNMCLDESEIYETLSNYSIGVKK